MKKIKELDFTPRYEDLSHLEKLFLTDKLAIAMVAVPLMCFVALILYCGIKYLAGK